MRTVYNGEPAQVANRINDMVLLMFNDGMTVWVKAASVTTSK